LYNNRVRPIYEAKVADAGAKTSKERMSIRRSVVEELWKSKDESIKDQIKTECQRLKDEKEELLSQSGSIRTPEEYYQYVSQFIAYPSRP
jgi:hypothetical protein